MPVADLRAKGLNLTARHILTCLALVQSIVLTVPEAAFAGAKLTREVAAKAKANNVLLIMIVIV
jgi:hypothetical protein